MRARWMGGLAALGIAALAAAGCGSSSSSSSNASTTAAPKADQTATWIIPGEPTTLDPSGISDLDSANTSFTMFVGLNRFSGKDNHLQNMLEQSHTVSSDGTVWTFKLKPAKWTNGDPVTAQDFVYGIERTLNGKTASPYAQFLFPIKGACAYNQLTSGLSKSKAAAACGGKLDTDGSQDAVGIKAIDDSTLQFTLTTPTPWFQQLTALDAMFPLPQATIEKYGSKWTEPGNIVTNGPFKMTAWKHNSEIDLVKNPTYFDADSVHLQKLKLTMQQNPQSAFRDFQVKKVDGGYPRSMIDAADIERAKKMPGYFHIPSLSTTYLYVNTKNPLVSDKRVRMALAMAIDRETITNNITKTGVPLGSFVPPGISGYDTIKQGSGGIDPTKVDDAKAKQLLKEAGWNPNKSIELVYTTLSSTGQAQAEQVQSDLAKIGVKVTLKNAPTTTTYYGGAEPPIAKDVALYALSWVADYNEATDFYNILTCASAKPGGVNTSQYCNKDYDKLYNQAVTTQDDQTRWNLEKQLEAKLTGPNGDWPAIPIQQPEDTTMVQPWIMHYDETPGGIVNLDTIQIAKH